MEWGLIIKSYGTDCTNEQNISIVAGPTLVGKRTTSPITTT